MSVYNKMLMVASNTPRHSPVRLEFSIREKIITRIEWAIDISSTKGLVGARIEGGGRGDLETFNIPIDAGDWLDKPGFLEKRMVFTEGDLPITILGHSEGTRYSHNIWVTITTE